MWVWVWVGLPTAFVLLLAPHHPCGMLLKSMPSTAAGFLWRTFIQISLARHTWPCGCDTRRYLIRDLTRGVAPDTIEIMEAKLKDAQVEFIDSSDVGVCVADLERKET